MEAMALCEYIGEIVTWQYSRSGGYSATVLNIAKETAIIETCGVILSVPFAQLDWIYDPYYPTLCMEGGVIAQAVPSDEQRQQMRRRACYTAEYAVETVSVSRPEDTWSAVVAKYGV